MSQDNPKSQRPQRPYQRNQPFWKSTIIQFLRGTIRLLETAVVKLETAPPPGTEENPGFWGGLLAKVRNFLPANLSAKLSDTALTGIIASIAVVLVWTTTSLFTNKPAEVAIAPPAEEVPTPAPTITTPPSPESTTPETPAPEEITPSPSVEVPPEPEIEPTPEATSTPEPTPTPTPAVQLTPEQVLIAAIENQVAEISDRAASGLIKSIQANFRTSNLTVKISDDWYSLSEAQQDTLAADILQRSQELDFTHLEVVDFQDRLVARNPVVGNEMIIFKRRVS
ncbi:hypothetical protein HCG51_17920 [Tolypothrix sp. PCC 7910]|uniref:hypothetical protein n=1 Tax=Tolypothrix sp. PCC 7910 TaxID=2099387 RepID=UPI00142786C7|nr:hypothetical protein [Tolypothrix sp. PCC 7910]QIR38397.1 hypothetical protein HCG51_17920 [Tolypothrix sp. PCC 7910]